MVGLGHRAPFTGAEVVIGGEAAFFIDALATVAAAETAIDGYVGAAAP